MGFMIGEGFIDLTMKTSGITAAIPQVQHVLEGVLPIAKRIGAIMAGYFGSRAIIDSVESQQAADAKLQASLNAVGGVAGWTTERFKELASSIQSSTRFSEESVEGAAAMLAKYGSLAPMMGDIIRVAADMAEQSGGDLTSTAGQIGFILANPEKALVRLQRARISFTDAESEAIKTMIESGQAAEAQRAILDKLKGSFNGIAEAMGNTLSGKAARAKAAVGELAEIVGYSALPYLEGMADVVRVVAQAIEPLIKAHADVIPKIIATGAAVGGLVTIGPKALSTIRSLSGALIGLATNPAVLAIAAIGGIGYYLVDTMAKGDSFQAKLKTVFENAAGYMKQLFDWLVGEQGTWASYWELMEASVVKFGSVAQWVALDVSRSFNSMMDNIEQKNRPWLTRFIMRKANDWDIDLATLKPTDYHGQRPNPENATDDEILARDDGSIYASNMEYFNELAGKMQKLAEEIFPSGTLDKRPITDVALKLKEFADTVAAQAPELFAKLKMPEVDMNSLLEKPEEQKKEASFTDAVEAWKSLQLAAMRDTAEADAAREQVAETKKSNAFLERIIHNTEDLGWGLA